MFMMIPAPLRQFKTWSMILLILDGLLNLAGVMINSLSDAHYISPATFGIVNIVFGFVIGAVRFVKQELSVTTTEKKELIAAAADNPVKPGHQDVTAVVVKTGETPTVAQPPTPAENTERLKVFIEMTVGLAIKAALAERDKARKRRSKREVAKIVSRVDKAGAQK